MACGALACEAESTESNAGGDAGAGNSSGAADGGSSGSGNTGSGGTAAGGRASGGSTASGGAFTGVACKVGDEVYPSGTGAVPDPFSCNTCTCEDGQLVGCTELDCPSSCPRDFVPATQCAQCGPVDECEVVEHGCFTECDRESDCRDGGFCVEGVCRRLCG